ncbi:MAG: tyrosine-type recombinase/integrase [Candidatus Bathyarchaeia archaeon]|jgi:site-specific recombinase XerD
MLNPKDGHSIRAELLTQDSVYGSTKDIPIEILFKIEKVAQYMEGKGRQRRTVECFRKHIERLARIANIDNPQEVELAIARLRLIDPYTRKQTNKPASNCYKQKMCYTYVNYTKFYKIDWELPEYTVEQRSIQPPSNEKVAMLIASAKGSLSVKIDISAQTGLRPIEIVGEKGIRVRDFHPDQKTLTLLSCKGCNPRPPLKLTDELATKIQTYISSKKLKADQLLFKGDTARYQEKFRRMRNRLADKLNDESIRSIRLYDLKHYYITKQLRRTQNAEIVRQIVGHKHLDTTQKYLHLTANTSNELIVEQTNERKRAAELTAADFKYEYTTPDGYMTFTKPK